MLAACGGRSVTPALDPTVTPLSPPLPISQVFLLESWGTAPTDSVVTWAAADQRVIMLRRAPPGQYEIRANVFAADRLNPNGAQRVTARIIRDFGRATEREEFVDIELLPDEQDRERRVGTVTFGAARR